MKNIFSFISVFTIIITGMFALSSCFGFGNPFVDDAVKKDCENGIHNYGEWASFVTSACQTRNKRECVECGNIQYATDVENVNISHSMPAITANVGDRVSLSLYSVCFTPGILTSASEIGWSSDEIAITDGIVIPSEAGIYKLNAKSGNKEKTIYLVVKNLDDSEYVLYFDDFSSSSLDNYNAIESHAGTSYYIENGKLIIDAYPVPDSSVCVVLPEWLGDFGNYEIISSFSLTRVVNDSRWFSAVARMQDDNHYWQAAVRQKATADSGLELAQRVGDTWNIPKTGSYTESISSSKYYNHSFKLIDDKAVYSINGVAVLESSGISYANGKIGLQVHSATASVDSVKVVLPVNASAHEFGEWQVTKVDSCTEDGAETRSCVYCNTEETREILGGHKIVKYAEKNPTCTESGWLAHEKCSRCDYTTLVAEIAPLGHAYNRVLNSVAHRGYSTEAPENTLPAFILAAEKGFSYIECDVLITKDGIPVLLHDDTIDRTSNGSGKVSELTYDQLIQYDFGSWKDAKYAGTKIPTFEEFVDLCAEFNLHPYIEIKFADGFNQAVVNNMVAIIDKYGLSDNSTWISFDLNALNYVKNADPTARLGYVISGDATQANIDAAKSLRSGENDVFLDLAWQKITNTGVLRAVSNGFDVEIWTVDEVATLLNLPVCISGYTSNWLLGANIVRDAGTVITTVKEASCTEDGLTEGIKCAACGVAIVEQTVIKAEGHTEEILPGKEATCLVDGLTEGKICNSCGEILVKQQTITAIGHAYDDDNDDTCNNCGFVRDISCAHSHMTIIGEAREATCTVDGVTSGEKCSKCGEVFKEQEIIPALGHSYAYAVDGILEYNVSDSTYTGLTVVGKCSICNGSKVIDKYSVDYLNSTINIEKTTINVLVSLKYVGGEFILAKGTYTGIVLEDAILNVTSGDVTINGNVTSKSSWLIIDKDATLTVNGSMTIGGSLFTADEGEYADVMHRLFVRQGTLNVNNDNASNAAIYTNSIQVGSQRDKTKGYLNITSAGNGIQIAANEQGRYVFANGEVNITGIATNNKKPSSALRFEGGGGARYLDIIEEIKFTVKNYNEIIWNGWKNVYAGICPASVTMENTDYILNTTSGSTNTVYLYSHAIVQVEYTDTDGRTGLANIKLDGLVKQYSKNNKVATFEEMGYPTADDYETWSGGKTFVSWVE